MLSLLHPLNNSLQRLLQKKSELKHCHSCEKLKNKQTRRLVDQVHGVSLCTQLFLFFLQLIPLGIYETWFTYYDSIRPHAPPSEQKIKISSPPGWAEFSHVNSTHQSRSSRSGPRTSLGRCPSCPRYGARWTCWTTQGSCPPHPSTPCCLHRPGHPGMTAQARTNMCNINR